jgi:hypothetical protein
MGTLLLTKTEKDAIMKGNSVQVQLTQQETLRFRPDYVEIQLDVLSKDGTPFRSGIYRVGVEQVLNEEALV